MLDEALVTAGDVMTRDVKPDPDAVVLSVTVLAPTSRSLAVVVTMDRLHRWVGRD